MRVLYRLYGEAEAEQDFFSSTTAASAYESFLVAVVSIHFFYNLNRLFYSGISQKHFFTL